MLLRLRHTVRDGLGDACEAAVAPQPLAGGQIGADRRADAARAVAAGACRAGDLAAEDLLAEVDLRLRRAGRRGELALPASGWMPSGGRHRRGGRVLRRRCRSGLDALGVGIARVSDAPDAARLVVADVERAVRADGQARRPVRGAARLLVRSGESVGEHDIVARTACRRRAAGTRRCSRPADRARGSTSRERR